MKYIISFLSLILFLGILFFYLQISKPESEINYKKSEKEITQIEQKIFKFKKKNFINLPVRDLYMKIDFNQYKYIIIYKIVIKNVDKYAFFNIKEILDAYKIAYSMIKEKNTEIYIFFKNLKEANSVLNLFKEYNFNIKIEKLKKRI